MVILQTFKVQRIVLDADQKSVELQLLRLVAGSADAPDVDKLELTSSGNIDLVCSDPAAVRELELGRRFVLALVPVDAIAGVGVSVSGPASVGVGRIQLRNSVNSPTEPTAAEAAVQRDIPF